jgi:hypothetical protein
LRGGYSIKFCIKLRAVKSHNNYYSKYTLIKFLAPPQNTGVSDTSTENQRVRIMAQKCSDNELEPFEGVPAAAGLEP